MKRKPTYILLLFLFLFASFFYSCSNNDADCAYKELNSRIGKTVMQSGKKISWQTELSVTIKSNLDQLGKIGGEVGGGYSEDIYKNITTAISYDSIEYSREFTTAHNSIVQILCEIDQKLNSKNITTAQKDILFIDMNHKRSVYFNLLVSYLEKHLKDNKHSIQESNKNNSGEAKVPIVKKCEKAKLLLFVNKEFLNSRNLSIEDVYINDAPMNQQKGIVSVLNKIEGKSYSDNDCIILSICKDDYVFSFDGSNCSKPIKVYQDESRITLTCN